MHIHPGMKTLFFVVRVNLSNTDTFACKSLASALDMAQADPGDVVEWGKVTASDAGAARLMVPATWTRCKPCDDCAESGDRCPEEFALV